MRQSSESFSQPAPNKTDAFNCPVSLCLGSNRHAGLSSSLHSRTCDDSKTNPESADFSSTDRWRSARFSSSAAEQEEGHIPTGLLSYRKQPLWVASRRASVLSAPPRRSRQAIQLFLPAEAEDSMRGLIEARRPCATVRKCTSKHGRAFASYCVPE